MRASHIKADVVTCCSLISALESGGQWLLGLQLFIQMCLGRDFNSSFGPLYRVGLALQEVSLSSYECGFHKRTSLYQNQPSFRCGESSPASTLQHRAGHIQV